MEKSLYWILERRGFMAEVYRFFDSIDGEDERNYTADEFADYFRQFIRNGIFSGGNNLKVETNEEDMKIFIHPGYAWIEGYLYKIDKEPLVLEHSTPNPNLNRIDRIVIRLDKALENRYVKAFILEGTPSEEPTPPELTRDLNVFEISLAKVEIIGGKSFIEAYQIMDERLNSEVCGMVTHLFEQVDTTGIFQEWQNYLKVKKIDLDLSFDHFVEHWQQWLFDKTSEPSGTFYSQWKNWFDEIKDISNLVTKTEFNEHNLRHELGGPDEINLEDLKGEPAKLKLHKADYLSFKQETESEIDYLKQYVSSGKSQLETAITGKGGEVSKISAVATFDELEEGISKIPEGYEFSKHETSTSTSSRPLKAGEIHDHQIDVSLNPEKTSKIVLVGTDVQMGVAPGWGGQARWCVMQLDGVEIFKRDMDPSTIRTVVAETEKVGSSVRAFVGSMKHNDHRDADVNHGVSIALTVWEK